MSHANGSEKRWDLGSSFSIDPGKLLGGSIVGLELGKFLEAGIKNTKTEKINRELSLLDFDENAAEENLARLIQSLATPRPLFPRWSRSENQARFHIRRTRQDGY